MGRRRFVRRRPSYPLLHFEHHRSRGSPTSKRHSAPRRPYSFPAKIAALSWARYQKLGGTPESGQVFLPCELIEANGTKLQQIVLRHAERWCCQQAFRDGCASTTISSIRWSIASCRGSPSPTRQALFAELGYYDDMMVAAEPFHLFVIEAPEAIARQLSAELPLGQAGLQVVWTQDLTPFRVSKVRVLNGAHTSSALAAFGAGLNTVLEMTQDATLSRYLEQLMFDGIVPFVPLPSAERDLYARTILERFANPHIRHELISISLNSVSKWQVRVLPTVHDYARQHGKAPRLLLFSLAALLHFYTGKMASFGRIPRRAKRRELPHPRHRRSHCGHGRGLR